MMQKIAGSLVVIILFTIFFFHFRTVEETRQKAIDSQGSKPPSIDSFRTEVIGSALNNTQINSLTPVNINFVLSISLKQST